MTGYACANFTFVLNRFLSSNKELSAFLNKTGLGGEAFPEVYKGQVLMYSHAIQLFILQILIKVPLYARD